MTAAGGIGQIVRSWAASPAMRRWGLRIGIVAGVAIFAIYLGLWAGLIQSGNTERADYTAFYTGWTIVAQGRGADLYDPAVQAAVQREVLGGRQFATGLNPFNNPPHLVLPFLPLTLLPLGTSYLVWGLIQLGLLAWLLYRLVTQVASGWPREQRALMVVAALAAPPLLLTFLQGAFSLLIAVAITELYICLRDRRDGRAGAWLLLGSLKPQAIVMLGVAVLAGRRWRTLAVGAGLGLIAVAAATVVLGPGIWPAYVRFLTQYVGSFDALSVRPSVMWNLRGTLTLLAGGTPSPDAIAIINLLSIAGVVAAIGISAYLWRGRWDPGTPAFDLRFSATIALSLLASPQTNPHDGLLLVPAGAIAYRAIRGRSRAALAGFALFLSPFVVLATNSLNVNESGGPPIRVPVLLIATFLVGAAIVLARGRRSGQAVA